MSKEIEKIVTQNKCVLFMKGSPDFPQCGFSATAINIILKHTKEFKTVNVLEDPAMRENIKIYSSWPTIPQFYYNGKFIGGCDILIDMDQAGELSELFD